MLVETKGKIPVEIVGQDNFRRSAKAYAKDVLADEFSGEILPEPGSTFLVEPINAAGAFPTNNAIRLVEEVASGTVMGRLIGNVYSMMGAKLGRSFTGDNWTAPGTKVLKAELQFNKKAGLTNTDDRLPPMFYNEPLPPYNIVVTISDVQMDSTFEYFKD